MTDGYGMNKERGRGMDWMSDAGWSGGAILTMTGDADRAWTAAGEGSRGGVAWLQEILPQVSVQAHQIREGSETTDLETYDEGSGTLDGEIPHAYPNLSLG